MDPFGGAAYGPSKGASRLHYKRVNILGMAMALYLPYLIFCLASALMIFAMVTGMSSFVLMALLLFGTFITVMCCGSCAGACCKRRDHDDNDPKGMSWSPFIWTTSVIAFLLALLSGYQAGARAAQMYSNIVNLSTYKGIDPARRRGQELMDAGQITFGNNTYIDFKRAIGFKNIDTYCVAPISTHFDVGDVPLSAYDFWTVGKNCCTSEGARDDFSCGSSRDPRARSGLRVMKDEDRPFFRLAVQQAESAYQIKAVHPLFFYWVGDPEAELQAQEKAVYRSFLSGAFKFFLIQLVLVVAAMCCFKRFTPW